MDAQPSTSREDENILFSPKKKRLRGAPLTVNEKLMINNTFKYVYSENVQSSRSEQGDEGETEPRLKTKSVFKVAEILGITSRTVYAVLKEHKENKPDPPKCPKKPGPKLSFKDKYDDFTFSAIRRIVHQHFYRNEHPTILKVTQAVNEDTDLPNFSRETLRKVLKHLNFKYATRKRKSVLIDRPDLISWRQRYLRLIKQYRREGRYIYYQDETWVNEGHTVSKVWTDENIKTSRQAFLEGLTTGLKNPTGKGKRLIISHIGGDEGFLEGGLLIFEAKKGSGDYHEEMNAQCFEEWFESILPKLRPNSVVVIDNTPYHSRKIETIPKMSWKKNEIHEWLKIKNISYEEDMVKATLIDLVKSQNQLFEKYAVDEMAAQHGIILLRLPPYHCELNPIELIWAQVKGHVAKNNKSFKMKEVKTLFEEGVNNVTPSSWSACVSHVLKVEDDMCRMDHVIDNITDSFIINVTSESEISDSDE